MSKETVFKVPTIDPKVLQKSRKSDLPRTATTVNIPLPSKDDASSGESFEEDVPLIPPVPYKEPTWSDKCDQQRNYCFEVEKNGVIIEEIKRLQCKPFWLFGRLPNCDINITHPTSSRYHAVLQYRPSSAQVVSGSHSSDEDEPVEEKKSSKHGKTVSIEGGWYLYDLNSTHGTFLNKQQILPRTYVRVRVGYMIKLGSSSRTYILQGPSDDEDAPTALTITELKEQARKQQELRKEMAEIERKEKERIEKLKESEGITWGMAEDADEATDLTENPYATSNNEELFLDDPKKTLRGYFEREGHDLEYKVDEVSSGTYRCKVELPIDDDNGRPIVAEVTHKGKKKEVVLQCALESCRILDRHGLLRQANHAPRRKHRKQSDSDDDDDFLDRTGAVEKRRERKQTRENPQLRTYTDLIHEEARILERLEFIENKIQNSQVLKKDIHLPENVDDVDKFLEKLSKVSPNDKFAIKRLRLEQTELRADLETVKKLINAVKPVDLESIGKERKDEVAKQKLMPLFGKRNKLSKTFGIRESTITAEKDNDIEIKMCADNESQPSTSSKEGKHVPSKISPKAATGDCSVQTQRKRSIEVSAKEGSSSKGNEKCTETTGNYEQDNGKKKRRHRLRDNKPRDNVDYDDTMEMASDEKNVEWVPPSGQTGDGRTSLNEKYGY
ncbi:kanadaptin isoform X1 [Anopheles ziemanni]|uniref:kanadaptin isoform X1 n=1 Tax=Anopheles coustani TaxID=139045 RepID=UPI002658AC90|nr:kanadaptin isoform X1 [Anopheles coustani]XP_058171170.1 kanadaptin isoform X1 [Anopheles ziemanni]